MFLDRFWFDVVITIAACMAYGFVHSLLASLACKQWLQQRYGSMMFGYRLIYNFVAVLLLIPIAGWLFYAPGTIVWLWPESLKWLQWSVWGGLAVLFWWSTRYYDMAEFMGTKQWSHKLQQIEQHQHLQISILHRFVRHPWYALLLPMVWLQDMYSNTLTAAVVVTIYLFIGLRLEEKKLIYFYGPIYRQYRQRVPALIPLPWRFLSETEAQQFQSNQSLQKD